MKRDDIYLYIYKTKKILTHGNDDKKPGGAHGLYFLIEQDKSERGQSGNFN